jgi:hypothetical protein
MCAQGHEACANARICVNVPGGFTAPEKEVYIKKTICVQKVGHVLALQRYARTFV